MNIYLQEMVDEIDTSNSVAIEKFSTLSSKQLNWKPSPNKWSVGQCIDHLIATTERYYPILQSVIDGGKKDTFWEKLPIWPRLIGKVLVKGSTPGSRKVKTMNVFEPSTSTISESILAEFLEHQHKLKNLIISLDNNYNEKVIITSPISKYFTYSLKDCLKLIVVHQKRHLLQAEEVIRQNINTS